MPVRPTAVLALLSIAGTASAQTWNNPAGGDWNDPANWSTGTVPLAAPDSAILPNLGAPYTVNLNVNIGLSDLQINGPTQTLAINQSRTLAVDMPGAGVINEGEIIVNAAASVFNSAINFLGTSASSSLSGSGQLVLNGGGSVDDAQLIAGGGPGVLFELNQPVLGAGLVQSDCDFMNNATITADRPGLDLRVTGPITQGASASLSGSGGGLLALHNAQITGGSAGPDVEVSDGSTINSVELVGTNGIRQNQSLGIEFPGATNNGTIIVDTTGSVFVTRLQSVPDAGGSTGTVTLDGTGTIQLNSTTADVVDAILESTLDAPLRVGAGQSIVGAGLVQGINATLFLDADVTADVLGLPLELRGTIEGAGTSTVVKGTDGLIVVGGGAQVSSVLFDGGVETTGSSTLIDCTVQSDLGVRGFATVNVQGTLTNNGLITMNTTSSAGNARMDITTDAVLAGTGQVDFNAGSDLFDAEIRVAEFQTFDVGSGQIISGTGVFDSRGMTTFAGTFLADSLLGTDLRVSGTLDLSGGTLEGTTGVVNLNDSDTTNGTFLDRVRTSGVSVAADFVNSGDMGVRAFANTTFRGAIQNNGLLTINTIASSGNSIVQTDTLGTDISGVGEIALNAGSDLFDAQIDILAGSTLQIGAGQTVTGTGVINAMGTLFMQGTFDPTAPGQDLWVQGDIDMTGGTAQSSTATMVFDQANVLNGVLQQTVATRRTGSFDGTVNNGTLGIRSNTTTGVVGTLTNNGTIIVNTTANNANSFLEAFSDCVVDGTGTIELNAGPDLVDATIEGDNSTPFQIEVGENQTVTGRGSIRGPVLISGNVSPGADDLTPDTIQLTREITLGASSGVALDVSGPTTAEFDRFSGSSTISIDGDLELRLQNGYVPNFGDRFQIIDAASNGVTGGFASVSTPQIGNLLFRVLHSADEVEAVWTCPADVNVDGTVSPADFTSWLALFGNPTDPNRLNADVNLDGALSPADFTAWLGAFSVGCP